MRMSGPAKISVSLPIEIKHILTVAVVVASAFEAYNRVMGGLSGDLETACVWRAVVFAAFFSLVKAVLDRFGISKVSAPAVFVPAILLALFLHNKLLMPVFILWLIIKLCEDRAWPETVMYLICDGIMIYIFFTDGFLINDTFTGKFVYASLLVLTISCLRRKIHFVFFLLLFLILLMFPVRKDPIDWNPVIKAMDRIADKTREMTWSFSYYLSDLGLGSSYHTGYSSLAQTGESVQSSDVTQLTLVTRDNTTFRYIDDETGEKRVRRRTIYLTGSEGADKSKLLDVLFSLYAHGTDPSTALLFSRTARIDITYEYLKTNDEILPDCLISIKNEDPVRDKGRRHKKGYRIDAGYLDIDYGSPYLMNIITSPVRTVKKKDVSYKTMAVYMSETYGMRLKEYVSEDEYAAWQASDGPSAEYLDIDGVTDRMRSLAGEITRDCDNDYEKCRAIEAFVRQYKYSTDTGSQGGRTTADARGLSDIADEFLFGTGQGYCVHFASSMVMLLRLNGIPARFTTGYRYSFPFDRQEEYEVKGRDAHAWPEAYIEGFGWIAFEPTAAYSTSSERTWHREADTVGAGIKPADRETDYEKSLPEAAVEASEEPGEDMEGEEAGKARGLWGYLRITLVIISAVILTGLLVIALTLAYKAIRYKRADLKGKYMLDIDDILGLLRSASSCPFDDRGVVSDYEPYLPDKYREDIIKAFEVYYRIKYSGSDGVEASEGKRARELRNMIAGECKKTLFVLW